MHIFAQDDDGTAPIDVLAYVRSDCYDAGAQLACGDDTECADAETACFGSESIQVREANLDVTLDPGVYFLFIDSYQYDRFTCGRVEVVISSDPV
ncbi:hypothetical protein [Microbacterium sp.]